MFCRFLLPNVFNAQIRNLGVSVISNRSFATDNAVPPTTDQKPPSSPNPSQLMKIPPPTNIIYEDTDHTVWKNIFGGLVLPLIILTTYNIQSDHIKPPKEISQFVEQDHTSRSTKFLGSGGQDKGLSHDPKIICLREGYENVDFITAENLDDEID